MRCTSRRLIIVLLAVLVFAGFAEAPQSVKDFYRSLSRRLGRNRADYPALSDEAFANFRMITTTGIAEGKLYRSSSPVSTWSERYTFSDKAAERAGVKTFVNLADDDPRKQAGFTGSYYSTQKIIPLGLSMKYQSKTFRESLAKGIAQMAGSEPPFLVHCSLGKDRAGFVCALLECLCGAGLDEVIADYLVSFGNYFGIEPGSREYDIVVECEITRFLAEAFGVKAGELGRLNLAEAGERYFRGIGVSADEIASLREKLKH